MVLRGEATSTRHGSEARYAVEPSAGEVVVLVAWAVPQGLHLGRRVVVARLPGGAAITDIGTADEIDWG